MSSTGLVDKDESEFAKDSLVVLKGSEPAVVVESGVDKLEVLLLNKKTKKVKSKDVQVLHPGPVRSWELEELKEEMTADPKKVEAAHGLLSDSGEATSVFSLASLIFGSSSPAAAWATFRVVQEDLYFHGLPGEVYAYPRSRVTEVCGSLRAPARHGSVIES